MMIPEPKMNIRKENELKGIVILDKPSGMTSHDVVARVRRIFKMKRVGHSGTLDPLATGVLVILLGKSTKLFEKFEAFDKAYKATMIFGQKTTTADIQGKIIQESPFEHLTKEQIKNSLKVFVGNIEQIPPMVSAVKINGKRLYELARKGIEVKREPRKIRIDKLELMDFDMPKVKFYLECSKGTYVRKLAEDIAEKLGTVACISQIQRTKVGPFTIDQAVDLQDLNEKHILNWTG
jgi:tRNA pseudouridine55 synthase